jgi:hypothetical protein
MRFGFLSLMLAGIPLFTPAARGGGQTYDIVIYGGTSAGVIAAVQAARMGSKVVLIEPGKHLGGMSSGGLGATDIGNKIAVGGLAREFYRRIRKHYNRPESWQFEKRKDFTGTGHVRGEDTGWTFEPHVAEKVFQDLVRDFRVPVVFEQRLDRKTGVHKLGQGIAKITMESGQDYRGKMFIDATYEGDLMAAAGVRFHVGRESNAVYGETLNGVQVQNATHHQFIKDFDPYVKPGDKSSGLVPRVHAGPPGRDGEGDRRVQAYNFRLCATNRSENRRPWPRPENYDETQYELLLRNFEAGDLRLPWSPVALPNGTVDVNNNFAFSTDDLGHSDAYPEADYATRAKIWKEHADYEKGLFWTLANHPRVPLKVRRYFGEWGLAKSEFTDNDNWPHQLYIREARRMIGGYVMTEQNCRGLRVAEDPVGLAAYTMDSHNTQRYVTAEGHVRNEGDVQVGGFPPYSISYRAMVPKAGECTNLLVPVCLSASHIAYGSIRMEPVFMVLGQSAATAAVHALQERVNVQGVNYPRLREQLLLDRQVLHWVTPPKKSRGGAGR